MKFSKNKKGVVSLYIIFLVVIMLVVFIAAFAAPMGVLLNSEMIQAGENIAAQSNESIEGIKNDTIRHSVQAVINTGFDGAEANIDVLGALFQYGWILVIAIGAVAVFLYARQIVEVRSSGGLI